MLPGPRFLLGAILLSVSILVFGLGAAALLRSAHEEFSANPSWLAPPEPRFVQPEQPAGPVLALLRVEPVASEQVSAGAETTAKPAPETEAIDSPTPALEPAPAAPSSQVVDDENRPPEAVFSETAVESAEPRAQSEPEKLDDLTITDRNAGPAPITSVQVAVEPVAVEPANPLPPVAPSTSERAQETKVATLSDQPALAVRPPKASAKSEENVDRDPARAQRAKARRSARARSARQQAALLRQQQRQQQAFPVYTQQQAQQAMPLPQQVQVRQPRRQMRDSQAIQTQPQQSQPLPRPITP